MTHLSLSQTAEHEERATVPDNHVPVQHTAAYQAHGRQRTGMLDGMREATRLTRAGRLTEATALIQDTLRKPRPQQRDVSTPPVPPTRRVRRQRTAPAATRVTTPERHIRSVARPNVPSTQPTGRFISASHSNRAGTRSYKLYVPARTGIEQSTPLIVMLHGCTQDADDFAAGTRMNALADAQGFLVVYPEQSAQANPSRCWNWFRTDDQRREGGEPSIIADITREVAATHDVDRGRIHVAGMSAGAAMAVIMGSMYPELYTAVGAHSGLGYGAASDLASALQAMKQGGEASAGLDGAPTPGVLTPTIVFHGDRDQTVHRRNGEQILQPWTSTAAQPAGGRADLVTIHQDQVPGGHAYTRYVYRDVEGRPVAEGWSVHGLGHAWSGGDPAGSYTDPKGPDASAEMLRFFADIAAQET